MEDHQFKFDYCPECGSSVRWDWICVAAGKHARCDGCGKSWHVIWDNSQEYNENEDES